MQASFLALAISIPSVQFMVSRDNNDVMLAIPASTGRRSSSRASSREDEADPERAGAGAVLRVDDELRGREQGGRRGGPWLHCT